MNVNFLCLYTKVKCKIYAFINFFLFVCLLIFSHENVMPMIPLGLKETKEISFMEPFSDFILEHYSEEPSMYMDAIADITDTRQVR